MIKKNDVILLGTILLLAAAAIIFINIRKTDGSRVVITIDGEEYKTLDLNKDTTLTIEVAEGAYNTVTVKNGEVDMTEANCPDKLCVKHRKIHYNGETIVCLPHKVVLQIVGGEESEADMIAK